MYVMTISKKLKEMTDEHIDDAKEFVEGWQYMKVKRLAEGLKIPRNIAGAIFSVLGWKPVNPNCRNNKTYENPAYNKII